MTMSLIETKTLTSSAASIEFTNIPQDATDLVALLSLDSDRSPAAVEEVSLQFNGSTANFTGRFLFGTGSGVTSDTRTNVVIAASSGNVTANTFANAQFYIPNYSGSTNKSFSVDAVVENNATEAGQAIQAGLWSNTAAITSIRFSPTHGTAFQIGSTISLYKITKA